MRNLLILNCGTGGGSLDPARVCQFAIELEFLMELINLNFIQKNDYERFPFFKIRIHPAIQVLGGKYLFYKNVNFLIKSLADNRANFDKHRVDK